MTALTSTFVRNVVFQRTNRYYEMFCIGISILKRRNALFAQHDLSHHVVTLLLCCLLRRDTGKLSVDVTLILDGLYLFRRDPLSLDKL